MASRQNKVHNKKIFPFVPVMQSSTHLPASNSGVFQFTSTNASLNGNHIGERRIFPNTNDLGSLGVVPPSQFQNKITIENVDPSQLEDDDSDSDLEIRNIDGTLVDRAHGGSLKPGKKTKGRVKIRMEFIENKLRRYTTFSKRKTGIMKKAYELSTLTGTQVMLLVASETGHVYTFATRKLQPMITSESGKALIQTCLNSPDPHPGQPPTIDQRMNPGGFEETELTYAVGDEEDGRSQDGELKPMLPTGQAPGGIPVAITRQEAGQIPALAHVQAAVAAAAVPPSTSNSVPASSPPSQTLATYIPQVNSTSTSTAVPNKSQTMTNAGVPMQLPNLPSGITILPTGTPITIPVQQNGQQIISSVPTSTTQQQAVYRIPTPTQAQLPSLTNMNTTAPTSQPTTTNTSSSASTATTTTGDTSSQLMDLPLNLISELFAGGPAGTPGIVMYHAPQGVVYATPTAATLPDRSIFNFQSPAQALSVAQPDQPTVSGGQQIITIPVPVSLAGSPQVLFTPTATESNLPIELTSQPTSAKRSRK